MQDDINQEITAALDSSFIFSFINDILFCIYNE